MKSEDAEVERGRERLLTTRGAVVLTLSVIAGAVTGVLTFYGSGHNFAFAVLAGLGAVGAAVPFFNALID